METILILFLSKELPPSRSNHKYASAMTSEFFNGLATRFRIIFKSAASFISSLSFSHLTRKLFEMMGTEKRVEATAVQSVGSKG